MPWPEPVTLKSPRVTLEPLAHARRDELIEAVRDGELWNLWYTAIPPPDKMAAEIDRRLGLQAAG
ncbi:MAG TPA: N-acetyltransferase, partial [Hyphomicrobiaceae bacterium]|nr:N-acetyltransferase [Hyphomicrobiaceae bacterium]